MGASTAIPCSSLKTAGVVVAIVEVLLCILSVYGLCRNLHLFGSAYWFWFLLGVFSVIVILLAIGLMLYAIKRDKPRWLIPHLSAQVFLILFLIVVAFVVFLLLLFGFYGGIRNLLGVSNYYISDDSAVLLGITIIVIYLLVAALEIFFLFIVWKLYKHMKHYAEMGTDGVAWTGALPKDAYHGSPQMGDAYPYGQDRNAAGGQDSGYGNQSFGGYNQHQYQQQQQQPLMHQDSRGYDRRY
ncbi:hypothetical protein PFISCL1PPCAC_20956 [Pristionchus fissidentatus]|uniref:DUF7027 domain-containing protein n=1 Tax=Pristionchus fissidentatus TaxID=1538716 RepID=A0AAV5WCE1_9BILA|nr:hypothetical protein PFISCL1PPCAC_20956 [Pristionchus fissidentatus]